MNELLEKIIADFESFPLPKPTRREAELAWLDGKIDTVIGMRRSGKTWFLFQLIGDLLNKGIPRQAILYINFEDERLLPMNTGDLSRIPEIFFRRIPALRDRECVFVFDEIQRVPGWETFCRRMLDTENIHLCLTGSSAKMLSREIATALRGRSLSTEIFPFSFREALEHTEVQHRFDRLPGKRLRSELEQRLRTYLVTGGFPEVQGLDPQLALRILQDYVDVVLFRDVVERHGVSNLVPVRAMIRHLMNTPANLFSVNKFYRDLRSQGIACTKNLLYEYLDHLTDAYLFFQVPIHSSSERIKRVNPRKVYAVDPGLVRANSRKPAPDIGHLLENAVFLELRRRGGIIEYLKTKSGFEVDFFSTNPAGDTSLIQVCANLDDEQTRSREVRALSEAMLEKGLSEALLINLERDESIRTHAGKIHVLPAWRWILGVFQKGSSA